MNSNQFKKLCKTKVILWTEDECASDAERKREALERFWPHENFDTSLAIHHEDDGDADYYLFDYGPYWIIVCSSYRGNNSIAVAPKEKN